MAASGRAIGVLGGTFDPVHKGHIAIAKSFLGSGYIDSLLVLLTPKPPHKRERHFANYNQRLRMLMAAFKSIENVKVSDLEFTLPKPSYTFQTMRCLKKSNPADTFYLCLGEDSFVDFKKWHKWKGILEFCELLVAGRPDIESDDINTDLANFSHFIEHKPVSISSTQIREKRRRNEPVEDLVPESVLKIIDQENLYL